MGSVPLKHFVGRIGEVLRWQSAMDEYDEYYGVGVRSSPLLSDNFTTWGTNNPTASAA